MKKRNAIVCTFTAVFSLISIAGASAALDPSNVDGLITTSDAFETIVPLGYSYEIGKGKDKETVTGDGATLYFSRDLSNGDLHFALKLPLAYVDETWGPEGYSHKTWFSSPKGKAHKQKELDGSDKAAFEITDSLGKKIVDFKIELGKTKAIKDLIAHDNSHQHNLRTYGSALQDDGGAGSGPKPKDDDTLSPKLLTLGDDDYVLDPTDTRSDFSNWEFSVIYEGFIGGDVLGTGDININITEVHASPSKFDENKLTDFVPVPEPTTACLLAVSLVGLMTRRKA
ncbi:PEP-CTERM sorting domain-containing protein [Poriferisphaera sp. WC338]|uniref:PEP-CTERM sorting domain-containing protein n=1 Tax=Poriferisphaera sp. WC338 TaxID=3425129 RepID=UPI003D815386